MSVYSGFSTRKAQTYYDKLTTELVSLLVQKLVGLNQFDIENQFTLEVKKLLYKMQKLQKAKYMPPKIGTFILRKFSNELKTKPLEESRASVLNTSYRSNLQTLPGKQKLTQPLLPNLLQLQSEKRKSLDIPSKVEYDQLSHSSYDRSKMTSIEGRKIRYKPQGANKPVLSIITQRTKATIFNMRLARGQL